MHPARSPSHLPFPFARRAFLLSLPFLDSPFPISPPSPRLAVYSPSFIIPSCAPTPSRGLVFMCRVRTTARWRCLGDLSAALRRKRTKSPFWITLSRAPSYRARGFARRKLRRGSLKVTLAGWLVAGGPLLLCVPPPADGYKNFIFLRATRHGRLSPQCARLLTSLYPVYVARHPER